MSDVSITPTDSPDNLKRCSKCGEWKPRAAFCVDNHTSTGLCSICRICKAEKARAYYALNKQSLAEKNRAYREVNSEKVAEYARSYYEKNHAKIRAQQAEQRNTPEHRKYMREWFKTPAGRRLKALRRASKRGANGTFTSADIEDIRKAQGNRCYICGKKLKKYHIDHFIPLALGGSNDPGNLRLACPHCNQRKSAKHPFELGVLL